MSEIGMIEDSLMERLLGPIGMLSFSVIAVMIGFLIENKGMVAMWGFFSMCVLAVIILFYTTSGDSNDD